MMSPKSHLTSQSSDTLAQAPFNDERADLILRSSDEQPVHFHVFKSILSVASPIFADMFSIPLPASQKSNEVQVVPLSEDSETLDLSLRHIYPVRSPKVVELRQTRMLAEFVRKYDVDAMEQDVTRYLTEAIDRDPVGVYVIAIKHGYRDVGIKAVESSLKLPSSRLQSPYAPEAPAEVLELFRYHATCGAEASAVASRRTWFPSLGHIGSPDPSTFCSYCRTMDTADPNPSWSNGPNSSRNFISYRTPQKGARYGPSCLWSYLQRSAVVLNQCPTADAVITEDFVLRDLDCADCLSRTPLYLLAFRGVFGTEIKKAIKKVPLPQVLR
ncbi:hypothetical protein BC827DRAFT_1353218 [Russula dissimulans]|nr:hypothetical protein BC827DRAFT_1353218 [Russula dissimulans]